MQTSTIILLPIALGVFVFGLFFFFRQKGSAVNRLFFFLCLATGIWMTFSTLSDSSQTIFWARLFAQLPPLGSFFIGPTILMFSFYFPHQRANLDAKKILLIYLPSIIPLLFLFTEYNITNVVVREWGTDFEPGLLYVYLLLNILTYITLALINWIRTFKKAKDDIARNQVKFIFAGIAMAVIVGVATNIILPMLNYAEATVYGPTSTLAFLFFTGYAIIRHKFLNLKVVATELFAFVVILVSLGFIFLSSDYADAISRIVLFAIIGFTAILLIRTVLQEVRRREEVQKLAKELEAANRQLKKLDQSKTEFISIASHQLRTPLAVTKGYVSMIIEGSMGKISNKVKESLIKINQSNEHLIHLVETMLNISRIETGRIEFIFKKTDILNFTKNIISQFEMQIEKKGMNIKIKVLNQLPKYMVFDSDKMGEVFVNLIDNAVKYGQKGDIEVTLENKDGVVEICVIDNGIGINKEDLDDIFLKFKRGVNATATQIGGSGLGLYICRKLIESHGGKIWAESPGLGKGSKLCIHLPKDPRKGLKEMKMNED